MTETLLIFCGLVSWVFGAVGFVVGAEKEDAVTFILAAIFNFVGATALIYGIQMIFV